MSDFVLERHSEFTNPPLTDLSEYVVSVTWTDRTQAPWDSLTFTIEWSPTVKPCENGDWCVLRLRPGGPAVSWCQVVACNAPNGMNGVSRKTGTWAVQCVGWMGAMMRAQLVSAISFADATSAGTMITMRGMSQLFEAVNKSSSLVGAGLNRYLRTVCRTWLPPSMAAQNLGDAIRVVYDSETAALFTGDGRDERRGLYGRQVERIPSRSMPRLSSGSESPSVMGIAIGSFKADDLLTECFPSLEDPGQFTTKSYEGGALGPAFTVPVEPDPFMGVSGDNRTFWENQVKLQRAADRSPDSSAIPPSGGTSTTLRPAGATPTAIEDADAASLAWDPSYQTTAGTRRTIPGAPSILGRNPVLIYRMRPWRDQALSAWAKGFLTEADPAVRALSTGSFTAFESVTWDISRAAQLTGDDVTGWPGGTPSADTATLFTTSWPGGQSAPIVWQNFGLPVVDFFLCNQRGAKTYNAYWPFLANYQGQDETTQAEMLSSAVAIGLQAAQFGNYNDRFWEGTISCQTFRPDVRHGEPFQLTLDGGAATLIGYVESVTHTLTRGASRASTTSFQYSRGLWDENQRNSANIRSGISIDIDRNAGGTLRDASTAVKVRANKGAKR